MNNDYTTIEVQQDERGVATVWLARPQVRNAMNGTMWEELRDAFARIEADAATRVAVLSGRGETFCSGGDLKYQGSQRESSRDERVREAGKLALLLRDMDLLSKPLVARVNGSAFAGAMALICVADVAIGTTAGRFAITEARLGMVPGMISPYVTRRVGISQARRLFLSARQFSGEEAVRYGLLHEAVSPESLDDAIEDEVRHFLACGPQALGTIKKLLAYVSTHGQEDNFTYAVDRVADMWDSPEAREGIASFFEKRKPGWHRG
ncbi:enoyl-CoA hydratase-related protein [Ramlibacter sp. PS3R-8]|uniref:enoyl-CoA hydratase-related protein n=1 Tax=Ramlibacter sp. PS3R-8 TaxID=3133437 RepID=UPI0030A1B9C9